MTAPPGPLKIRQIEGVWILGAGFFGRRALDALRRHFPVARSRITVVDRDPRRLAGLPAATVCTEAVAWLKDHLAEGAGGEASDEKRLVIPALPIHVAAEWLKVTLPGPGDWEALPVPEALTAAVPNPHPFPRGGGLYTSIATWRCPDDCPAPVGHCPHTGKPRDPDLYDALGGLKLPGQRLLVIHSRQVAPGVGGYTARQLLALLHAARLGPDALVVATICRCHGVIDCFGRRQ